MESWGVLFLGIIALASLVQAAFVVALAVAGRRVARRVDEIQRQLDHDIRPALEQVTRISRNLGEISDRAVLQARRIDTAVSDALREIDGTVRALRRTASESLGPLFDLASFAKGIRRGIEVYQALRGFDRQRRGKGRVAADEEEPLFI
jgi:hypothetical protein